MAGGCNSYYVVAVQYQMYTTWKDCDPSVVWGAEGLIVSLYLYSEKIKRLLLGGTFADLRVRDHKCNLFWWSRIFCALHRTEVKARGCLQIVMFVFRPPTPPNMRTNGITVRAYDAEQAATKVT